MNLKTQVGACLFTLPYDNFRYVKIISDDALDQKLQDFIIDKFKINDNIAAHLNAAKIAPERFDIFKSQAAKVKGIQLLSYNFVTNTEFDEFMVSRWTDGITTVYTVEGRKDSSCRYLIY